MHSKNIPQDFSIPASPMRVALIEQMEKDHPHIDFNNLSQQEKSQWHEELAALQDIEKLRGSLKIFVESLLFGPKENLHREKGVKMPFSYAKLQFMATAEIIHILGDNINLGEILDGRLPIDALRDIRKTIKKPIFH